MKHLLALALVSIPSLAVAQTAPAPAPAPAPAATDAAAPAPATPAPAATDAAAPAPAPAPATVTATATGPVPGQIWVGGGFSLATAGSVSSNVGGGSVSADLKTTGAIDLVGEYQINKMIAVGLWPRYVFGVNGSSSTGDSGSMLDLRARVSVGGEVAPQIRVYGVGGLGWGIVMPPSSDTGAPNASGVTLTVGGGASYAISSTLRAYAEAAYELGFESESVNGQSTDDHVTYLEIGAGIQVAFGGH